MGYLPRAIVQWFGVVFMLMWIVLPSSAEPADIATPYLGGQQINLAISPSVESERMVRISANLVLVSAEEVLAKVDAAKLVGANTVVFSDSKTNNWWFQSPGATWFERMEAVRNGVAFPRCGRRAHIYRYKRCSDGCRVIACRC